MKSIPVLEVEVVELEHSESDTQTAEIDKPSALRLAELLLKDRTQVENLLRDESRQADLIPRFLAISLTSFSLFGWMMVMLLFAVPAGAIPSVLAERWSVGPQPAIALWLAYTLGLIAATGICLPSFYFYGLLAGIRISFLQVVSQCLKGQASTAIMLIGVLPIYVAVALGMLIFRTPEDLQQLVLSVGLALPFFAGLWGVYSIYTGFMRLADTLPGDCRERRTCFLRRLTLAWAACYTAVTPLMIYALWTHFAG
ncbi:MAG TPA: hypothetical protein VFE62_29375 [Gemmataceae bacterium]|nr:hypothetical protein [Gemmataceae bacterium]